MISYKVLKDTITEYWKESKEINAIVSGGSYDQNTGLFTVPVGYRGHIQPPETAPLSSAGSWEIKTKVTYRGGGRYPCIFGYGGGSDYKAPCLLSQGGTYKIAVSFTGGGWDIWGETGIAPQQNTTYYFKVGFTGDTYYVDYRTEGQKAYTRAFSYSSTETAVCITPFWFMDLSLNNDYPTYGDLDLTETSISINGEIWWQGTKGRTPATPEDYDIITTKTAYKPLTETDAKYWKYEGKTINGAGSGAGWTIDEDNDTFMNIGTASFQTPETLPLATANSWEIGLVARMTSSGTDPCFVGYTGTSDFKAPCLTFSYNTLRVFLSTTGTSWNLASSGDTGIVKEMNRTYYVKYGFTGGTYYVDLHLDGEDTYRRVWSMNSTAKVHCSVPHQFMGLNLNPSYYAVKGVLYLDDVYCKINGDMYWQAVKRDVVPATSDDYDFTTETHVYKALRVQYVPEHVWERPLTEDGTIGVSDFAVTSSGTNTYLLFDQNPDTDWVKTGAAGWWSEYIEFYIKEGVKLQSLDITNSTQGGTVGNGGAFIQASNDGSNWTDIASNTPIEGQTTAGATWRFNVNSDTTYTYFQMKMLGGSTLRLQEIKINAIQ